MGIKFIKYYMGALALLLLAGSIILYKELPDFDYRRFTENVRHSKWTPPDTGTLTNSPADLQVKYGRDLVSRTAFYLGPKGTVARITNGMNCQNCHLDAGSRLYGNPLALVATRYPAYRPRSGRIETIAFRINDCMVRSMNGSALDSQGREMQAMIAYLKWLGKDVDEALNKQGLKMIVLPLLPRAADTIKGRVLFQTHCIKCHGAKGEGLLLPDSTGYAYPPLWGAHSYNSGAGLYRLSRLSSFIKFNMPYLPQRSSPQLSNEEAWDLAAFISSRPRPYKHFPGDWPEPGTKPFDYPFPPFADSYPATQHQFGPFTAGIK